MKKYFVHYYLDFANTYNLYWADNADMMAALPDGAEQITRKEAETLCRREREARNYDNAFAYHATSSIYPAGYKGVDIINDKRFALNGCIWDRVTS